MLNRRGLITGLISFVAAPALVKASSLMPVKTFIEPIILNPRDWHVSWITINARYGKFAADQLIYNAQRAKDLAFFEGTQWNGVNSPILGRNSNKD